AGRTNSFWFNGELVLSTYGQNNLDWSNSIFRPLRNKGIEVFFIPFFWPELNASAPSYATAALTLQKYAGIVGGLFWFTAAGLADQMASNNTVYAQACKNAGKPFMAGVCPHYWGMLQTADGRRYYETQGGEGLALQWSNILTNQPDWVEICTWNDFNESTYVA